MSSSGPVVVASEIPDSVVAQGEDAVLATPVVHSLDVFAIDDITNNNTIVDTLLSNTCTTAHVEFASLMQTQNNLLINAGKSGNKPKSVVKTSEGNAAFVKSFGKGMGKRPVAHYEQRQTSCCSNEQRQTPFSSNEQWQKPFGC